MVWKFQNTEADSEKHHRQSLVNLTTRGLPAGGNDSVVKGRARVPAFSHSSRQTRIALAERLRLIWLLQEANSRLKNEVRAQHFRTIAACVKNLEFRVSLSEPVRPTPVRLHRAA